MIVTIDGPAGAGKSSAAKALAKRLGFHFLDTGAMYRAVVHAALERGVDLDDAEALEQVAASLDIQLTDDAVLVDGQDVTRVIRTQDITTATRYAADHPGIRARLVELQRAAAEGQNFVTEGRDQGSIVFPHAECKIFLTASERVRAERRYHDLTARGEQLTFEEVLEKQQQRDQRDASRPVGALIKARDAVVLDTDGMSAEEVVDRLHEIVMQHQ
ncbi:(d)CMP kinase [Aeoliella sp. ICT_H6.2]|uniref:Cytidylate kinase n=1 Tax=Aeoliella straminimaris TaxID=2954799 RepID=A0A9X2JIX6_9BACT|nr:(d)CMP kinase [Aeoliella straminimaris]MCO6047022.1 (d)CMP kinase [Aeoliella straminimaris]